MAVPVRASSPRQRLHALPLIAVACLALAGCGSEHRHKHHEPNRHRSKPSPAPIGGHAPSNRVAPYFTADSGTAVVGQTLAVTGGTWSGNPTSYSYRWESCTTRAAQPPRTAGCATIRGATSASHRVSSADVGHSLAVIVTAANRTGPTATRIAGACATGERSSDTPRAPPPPSGLPGCSPISAMVGTSAGRERFCSNAFTTCGYVDPPTGDVGVPPGVRLKTVSSRCHCLRSGVSWSDGALNVTGDGVTLRGLYVPGSVRISGRDDILTESEVTTGICGPRCNKPEPIIVLTGARNAQITYTTVSGGSNGTLHNASEEPALFDHDYTYGACTGQEGWGDITNSFIITDVSISDARGEGACHTEAGYVPGCKTAHCETWSTSPWHGTCPGECSRSSDFYTHYRDDVLLNPQDQTAAIFLDNHAFNATGNYNVTVDRSFVAGGDYSIYGDAADDASSNIVITGNRWSTMYYRHGGSYGPCGFNPAGTTVSGNVWDDDLRPVTVRCAAR